MKTSIKTNEENEQNDKFLDDIKINVYQDFQN